MQWRSGLLQRAVFGSTAKSSAWVAHGRVPYAGAPVLIVIVGSRTQGCLPVLAPRGAIVIVTGLRRGNGARRAVRGGAVVIWNVAAHLLRLR